MDKYPRSIKDRIIDIYEVEKELARMYTLGNCTSTRLHFMSEIYNHIKFSTYLQVYYVGLSLTAIDKAEGE